MPLLVCGSFVAVAARRASQAIAAAAAGVAAWAVPLVWFSGGPRRYLQALGSQAGEDFSGVVMLWTHPTPRAPSPPSCRRSFGRGTRRSWPASCWSLAAAGALDRCWRDRRARWPSSRSCSGRTRSFISCSRKRTRFATPCRSCRSSRYLAAGRRWPRPTRARSAVVAVALAGASLVLALPADARRTRSTPSPIFALLSEMRMLQDRGAQPRRRHAPARVHRVAARALYAGDAAGDAAAGAARLRMARADARLARGPRRRSVVRRRSAPNRPGARRSAHARTRAVSLAVQRPPSTSAAPGPTRWTGTSSASRAGFSSRAGR